MKKILICLLFSGSVFAYTNLGILNFGDPVYVHGGRSIALGLTDFSSSIGAETIFKNPAGMSRFSSPRLFLNFPIAKISERIIPDNDWSGETGGVYYNDNTYIKVPEFAVVYPFSKKLKLGAGMREIQNFDYKHKKDVYSGETPQGTLIYDAKGSVNGYNISFSMPFFKNWNFGFGYEMISGNPDIERKEISGTFTEEKYSYSGSRNIFSFFKERGDWNAGFFYIGKANLDYDLTFTSGTLNPQKYKGTLTMPKTIGFGINYIWGGAVSASFYFDVIKTYWSDLNRVYKDRISFHTGIENEISARVKLRYGMAFIPSYEETSVERVFFTAGIGYYVSASMYLDVGFAYGKRDYLNQWEGSGVSCNGRVDETMDLLSISLDWKL